MKENFLINLFIVFLFITTCSAKIPVSNWGDIDTYMGKLLSLSNDNTKNYYKILEGVQKVINRSISQTSNAKSFSSIRIVSSHYGNQSEQICRHQIDFSNSNRFFVTQSTSIISQGMLYDEWVSIGEANYQNGGLWGRTEDSIHNELNFALTPQNFIEILRENYPIDYSTFFVKHEKYLILEYSAPVRGNYNSIYGDAFSSCNTSNDNRCHIFIWINLHTNFLTKVEVAYLEKYKLTFLIFQVFGCYNENINVTPPPWLNLRRDPWGYTMISEEIPIMEHYACEEN